ncbi:BsuBI/PstI family type II restriction endonuclease [Butyricicoccus intestinisimiae]|uniref:BsuBI/PstI family type II restriction endonuclease n=1 Tax=Butyricicoccus intestinisimiae TaxID=2841509 RepID=UPI0038B22DD2
MLIVGFRFNPTGKISIDSIKQFSESLAWETEVWIADMPDHMIHLNGDKFLGPRKSVTYD